MKSLLVPIHVLKAIEKGAVLALSLSGGKDGQAMARAVVHWLRKNGHNNKVIAVHADLGKVEWKESLPQCRKICAELGIELFVVERKGGLLKRWRDRMMKLLGSGKPFWSSAKQRYCTSDMKRGPINKLLRKYSLVISAEGIRSQESKKRKGKPVCELRKAITSKAYKGLDDVHSPLFGNKRLAITWNAIKDWTIDDVWASYGHTQAELNERRKLYKAGRIGEALKGWSFHPAYVYGNERVSCVLCILGSDNDLENGARHYPEVLDEMIELQDISGFTFREDLDLRELKERGHGHASIKEEQGVFIFPE